MAYKAGIKEIVPVSPASWKSTLGVKFPKGTPAYIKKWKCGEAVCNSYPELKCFYPKYKNGKGIKKADLVNQDELDAVAIAHHFITKYIWKNK